VDLILAIALVPGDAIAVAPGGVVREGVGEHGGEAKGALEVGHGGTTLSDLGTQVVFGGTAVLVVFLGDDLGGPTEDRKPRATADATGETGVSSVQEVGGDGSETERVDHGEASAELARGGEEDQGFGHGGGPRAQGREVERIAEWRRARVMQGVWG